jgi:hypothetical protein
MRGQAVLLARFRLPLLNHRNGSTMSAGPVPLPTNTRRC